MTDALLLERRFDLDGGSFELKATRDLLVSIEFGTGTVGAARALLGAFDEILRLAPGRALRILGDLRRARGAQLRAQVLIGRWLLAHHGDVGAVALWGATPVTAAVVSAVRAIARTERIRLFATQPEAARWLAAR